MEGSVAEGMSKEVREKMVGGRRAFSESGGGKGTRRGLLSWA